MEFDEEKWSDDERWTAALRKEFDEIYIKKIGEEKEISRTNLDLIVVSVRVDHVLQNIDHSLEAAARHVSQLLEELFSPLRGAVAPVELAPSRHDEKAHVSRSSVTVNNVQVESRHIAAFAVHREMH